MRRIVLGSLFLISGLALGCSSAGAGAPETIDNSKQPIIGGSQDNTHVAAVALLNQNTECTGTIVQVSGGNAYVLTAGHCCDPNEGGPATIGVLDVDYNNQNALAYNVVAASVSINNGYNLNQIQNGYDFCMLQLANVDPQTPVIPAMTPAQDGLANGSQMDIVGYGQTSGNPQNQNSLRNHIQKSLAQVDPLLIWIDNSVSGTCQGDSGGPWIDVNSGTVAGVTSFGAQGCTGPNAAGAAGRVSAVYANFIQPYLNGMPAQPDCNTCQNSAQSGACASQANTCVNNQECIALSQCYQNCSTQACINQCDQQHAGGVTDYNNYVACICNTACVAECAMQCGGSSSSSSSSSSTSSSGSTTSSSGSTTSSGGTTTSSGMTTSGQGGSTSVGVGAGGGNGTSGEGGSTSGGDSSNNGDGNNTTTTSCSTSGAPGGDGTFAFLAGLALVAGAIRRKT